ncbi:hypothetical protein PMAYCL1PPCAC_30220, partial [Pristionchus mayeri]
LWSRCPSIPLLLFRRTHWKPLHDIIHLHSSSSAVVSAVKSSMVTSIDSFRLFRMQASSIVWSSLMHRRCLLFMGVCQWEGRKGRSDGGREEE